MPDQVVILLAEDREDDIILIQRAFEKAGCDCRLVVVRDGDEAVRYLSGSDKFAARDLYPFPTLLLLDLKLPMMDGFEVLRWIRDQPELKDLPVIVLTLSNRIRDVNEAYALGAYSFLIKTTDFQDTVAFAQSLSSYWFNLKHDHDLSMPAAVWPKREDLAPNTGIRLTPCPLPAWFNNQSDIGWRIPFFRLENLRFPLGDSRCRRFKTRSTSCLTGLRAPLREMRRG